MIIERALRAIASTLLLAVVAAGQPALAEAPRLGSCYTMVPQLGVKAPDVQRDLLVLMDQTVEFDPEFRTDVTRHVLDFMKPGDKIILVAFSSYGENRYTRIVLEASLDLPIKDADRYYIGKYILQRFDSCMTQQKEAVAGYIRSKMGQVFSGSTQSLEHTEIVGTINQLAVQGRANRGAKHYWLLVSDMLENSSVTSFYKNGQIRVIDPQQELGKFRSVRQVANLAGARVFVAGAGFSQKDKFVPETVMQPLEKFWTDYFAAANAQLVEFGRPMLLRPIE